MTIMREFSISLTVKGGEDSKFIFGHKAMASQKGC